MAVTAKFVADFASFHTAVQKAGVELKSFETGASKVGTALNRMAESFSGRKIITDATLMAEVFQRAGGAAAFTNTELQRMGTTGAEALAKLKATGQPIPPQLQAMTTAAAGASGGFASMLGTVSKLAGAFGIAFSVGAVVGFGKALIADADALVKLSDKTDLSIGALIEMRRVGKDTSVTIDAMASSVTFLQRTIAGGDRSAVEALERLGLKFSDIRRLSPEDQYFTIAAALRGVADQNTQVELGTLLLGRAFAETLPAIKEGFKEITKEAEQTVRALDDIGDAAGRVWQAFKDLAGTSLVGLYKAVGNIADNFIVLGGGQIGAAEASAVLEPWLKKVAKAEEAAALAAKGVTISVTEQANIERQFGVTLKDTTERRKESTKAHEDAATKVKKAVEMQQKFLESVADSTEKMHLNRSALNRYIAAIPGAVSGTGRLSDEMLLLTSRSLGLEHVLVKQMPSGFGVVRTAMQQTGAAVRTLGDTITGHLSNALQQIPQLFIDAFTGGGGVLGALKGIGVSLLNAITRDLLQPIWDAVASWAVGIGRAIAGAFMGQGFSLPSMAGLGSSIGGAGGIGGLGSQAAGVGTGLLSVAGGLLASAMPGLLIDRLLGKGHVFDSPDPGTFTGGGDYWAQVAANEAAADTFFAAAHGGADTGDRRRFEGFAGGTHGQYLDFGRGTPAILHGREKITPAGEADASAPRQPVTVQVLLDGKVVTQAVIDNILKDTGGIRRVIKRVAS